MKKVLFLSLAMIFATSIFAQQGLKRNPKAAMLLQKELVKIQKAQATTGDVTFVPGTQRQTSLVNNNRGENSTMQTKYDLQTNGCVSNRAYRMEDGTMAFTATMALSESPFQDRGTGYNFYNGSAWTINPTEQLEMPIVEPKRSGWPSIVPYGDGEILVSHDGTNVNVYKRETRGAGEWISLGSLPTAAAANHYSWPKAAVTTDGTTQYVHVIASWQELAADTFTVLRYWRSADGCQTWEVEESDELAEWGAQDDVNSDYVSLSTNGSNIAMVYAYRYHNLEYIISHDNGASWEHNFIYRLPFDDFFQLQIPAGDTIEMFVPGSNGCSVMGDDGVLHVAFDVSLISRDSETEPDYLSYYTGFGIDGIAYWNSTMGEFERHPSFVDNTQNPNETLTMDSTLCLYHLAEINRAAGALGGSMYGVFDETFDTWEIYAKYADGQITFDNFEKSYRTGASISIFPTITVDSKNNVAIAYASYTKNGDVLNNRLARRIYLREYNANTETWQEESTAVTGGFVFGYAECIYPQFPNGNTTGSDWHVFFNSDSYTGLFLDQDQNSPSTQESETDNTMYHVNVPKLDPDVAINEEAANITFSIFPNPASSSVVIEVAETSTVEVFNAVGQLVNVLNGVQGEVRMDVSNYAHGVYLVNVRNANGASATQKLIVR